MRGVAEWLRATSLSEAIWSALWLIRLLQAVHLLAAGAVSVSGLMIAMRALGWRLMDQSFDAVWRRFAPWLGWGFAVMFITGIGQTLADPVREFTATSWWLKMGLVLYVVVATIWLGRRLHGAAPSGHPTRVTKLVAIAIVLSWLAIVLLGRMIAYDLPFWGILFVAHMNMQQLIVAMQESALAEWMRYTPRAMPLVEALHVLAAVMVFGTLLAVDLRLLGFSDTRRAFSSVSRQMLPLTWSAFVISAVTGALMFVTSAQTYYANPAFRMKMLALAAAAVNMAFFQLVTLREADRDLAKPLRQARIAGAVSLLLWAGIVLLGRWIGFTKGYDFSMPDGAEFDFGN